MENIRGLRIRSTRWIALFCAVMSAGALHAQVDTTAVPEEEDFSIYENLDFSDGGTKRYCTSKVLDLSPQKLISLGYDVQGPYTLTSDTLGSRPGSETDIRASHGIRAGFNIPLYSRNSLIIQGGISYLEQRYALESSDPLAGWLNHRGLRSTTGLLTVFKPVNEVHFFIAQAQAEMNGNYALSTWQPLNTTRLSGTFIWGWKKNDRKMIGVGLGRSYRAGDLNYLPVFLLNWTAPSRKWGVELLAPARGHIRRTFTPRHMLFIGYELEGGTYRLSNTPQVETPFLHHELRRSELRFRAIWEQSISGFIWISVQAGLRYNFRFYTDDLPDNRDFFRGFFGDQPYAMENTIGHAPYAMVGIHLVSP
ncbi:MAG: hypothetical protein ACK57W_05950 [Flavobacteriales bacterium]